MRTSNSVRKSGPRAPGDIGFRIITHHHGFRFRTMHARERRTGRIRAKVSQDDSMPLACELQRRDECTCIETELSIRILERPIWRECQEIRAPDQFSKCRIQRPVVENLAGVANSESLALAAGQTVEVRRQIRMDQKVGAIGHGGRNRARPPAQV